MTSLATGDLASFSLQCQAAEGQVGYSVNLAVNGATGPGSYVIGNAPAVSGIASYTEQGVNGGTKALEQYRQFSGWSLTLDTATDAQVAGSAAFVGELDATKKPVTLAFNFALKK
jgi:hypothetical protein